MFKLDKKDIPTIVQNILTSHYPDIKANTIAISNSPNIINIRQFGQQYILKIHNPLISDNLKQLEEIYYICSKNGLIPKIILSKAGKHIIKDGDIFVSLQKKIPHEEDEIDPIILGERVAQLHSVLSSLQIHHMENHLQRTVNDILKSSIQYGYENLIPLVMSVREIANRYPAQVIHGDLHIKNIMNHNRSIYFIDLDSANSSLPMSEIAFSAFKIFGFKDLSIRKYIDCYNKSSKWIKIEYEYIWHFVVFNILQRILFIRIEDNRGNDKIMWDLSNQERYLKDVLEFSNLIP